jgi:hypothetical protein
VTRPVEPTRRRLRAVYLAPVLAFVALAAWAFASPVGAGPDDDYHLVSAWCAAGGSAQCEEGSAFWNREVAVGLVDVSCFALEREVSASCQDRALADWDRATIESDRGNFRGDYPQAYYTAMRVFAGADLQTSALVMRLFNAALFVALATALAVLMPTRRPTLLWGWLVTLVPLGMFLIPSNNPSGWAITGVGTAFLALLGAYESVGRRRVALAVIALVAVLMAAGARGDAAVYAVGAVVTATIIAGPWRDRAWRTWWRWAWLPLAGILIAAGFFLTAGQAGVAGDGFGSTGGGVIPDLEGVDSLSGFALAAYNLLMLPFLWTGVWGTWPLGWLDTGLPDTVAWAATAAFIVVAFAGIGRLNRRKAIAAGGVLLVLIVLPVWVLTRGGDIVGENLQPRYLLPLIVLFAFILLTMPSGRSLEFGRVQTVVIFVALGVANFISLQVNIRRYVTGVDEQGLNLDAGAEWWWTGFPIGPSAVWVIGALAYAALLVLLWPQLRRQIATDPAL